jgi:hypothetical protein
MCIIIINKGRDNDETGQDEVCRVCARRKAVVALLNASPPPNLETWTDGG